MDSPASAEKNLTKTDLGSQR